MQMQKGDRNSGRNELFPGFRTRLLQRYHEARLRDIPEPTFGMMKETPAAKEFISHLKSAPVLTEAVRTYGAIAREKQFINETLGDSACDSLPEGFDKLAQQKTILILDDSHRVLGAIRWIRGEGEPFFVNSFGRAEAVESILAQVPVPAAPDAPATVAVKPAKPEYGVRVSETSGDGEFRIHERPGMLAKTANELHKAAPSLDYWALRSRFDALKSLSEARDFIAKFRQTTLRYELAGTVMDGRLAEAAVFMFAESGQPVAAIRYVRGEGRMFFQNLLDDKSQSVDAVLASLKCAQPAPSTVRQDSSGLFWMGL
ncbi:MAG: hypothetical protein PHV13_05355 [Candidatus ainarchaeum sp.]|nr:hypothetical protein [Candidatus ainarchaeum sp.]